MNPINIFNLAVCAVGMIVMAIHIVGLLLRKQRRADENLLLTVFFHTFALFLAYLIYLSLVQYRTNNAFFIGFTTLFSAMNNVEAFIFFLYVFTFLSFKKKSKTILLWINIILCTLTVMLCVTNPFTNFLYEVEEGVIKNQNLMFLTQIYQVFALLLVFVLVLIDKKLKRSQRICFILYSVLLGVAFVLQLFFPYAFVFMAIIASFEILLQFVDREKRMELQKEKARAAEAQIDVMLSQIQPHFIYNALSSVSTLIEIDPPKAQKAIDDFMVYLRGNLSSLTNNKLIPFDNELRHVKAYLSLEQIRFGHRLEVNYDIQVNEFFLPPLTLQPIVENAVKHGLMKKRKGGLLFVSTKENEDGSIWITVEDDGVGFDVDSLKEDGIHIGISNVRARLESICGGGLQIKSKPQEGTKAIIILPHKGEKE